MQNKDCILGIDTSNYTTSVAVTDKHGDIIADARKVLHVKEGEKGLRQSEAFFQHIKALPELMDLVMKESQGYCLAGVSASTRPRPTEGSYMPVFKAGESVGRSIALAQGIPFFDFSHQEGHIEAVKFYVDLEKLDEFLCFHLSGGTCEILKVKNREIEIIGGSKDISIGQLLDRVGVGLNLKFPAGEEMDRMALTQESSSIFKKVELDQLWFNLSGIETMALRNLKTEGISTELFEKLSDLLIRLANKAVKETKISSVIFAGGVSESKYIRNQIQKALTCQVGFGRSNLSRDNAVGISLLGGRCLWP